MNTEIILVYTTDNHHTQNSKQLLAVCTSKFSAINLIQDIAKEEDETISQDDLYNLEHINQTQNYQGYGEFIIEEQPIDTIL